MAAGVRSEQVPAEPFIRWLKSQLELLTDEAAAGANGALGPNALLAARLGMHERQLNRFLRGVKASSRNGKKGDYPTDTFARVDVEDALDRAGVGLWELYPGVATEHVSVADRFCGSCRERVSTGADFICPWCERLTESLADRVKLYCAKCDRMAYPAHDGSCWRCGQQMRLQPPWDACGCGCGTRFSRFDVHGRRRRWVRGHAPKPHLEAEIPVEPFAKYLEEQLRELDPIEALARMHGISRNDVLYALGRRGPMRKDMILSGLRNAGMQGKGLPRKAGVPAFSELYPQEVRSRTCPDCGNGKAPHAQRCKACSRKHTSATQRSREAGHRLRDELLDEAWRLHMQEGMPMRHVAKRLLQRTPYASAQSLASTLAAALRSRGQEPQRGIPIPDELLEIAYRLHTRAEMPVDAVARHLHGRSNHPTPEALRSALYRRFREKGYKLRRGHPPLPAAVVKEAWRAHMEEGLTVKEAAERLGVHPGALAATFRKRGLKVRRGPAPRHPDVPDEVVDEAYRLHIEERLVVRDVAARLDVDADALYTAIRRRGLKLRRGPGVKPAPPASLKQTPSGELRDAA